MIVIKLGGSLISSGWLPLCLEKIEQAYRGRAVVIVPGGGIFADQVRLLQQELKFNDRTAHEMALLAMRQMALLVSGLKPGFTIAVNRTESIKMLAENQVVIWSPDISELDDAKIPATWAVTSDSLSAWLANKLDAKELILVKSAKIDINLSVEKLAEQKIVDAMFCEFSNLSPYSINIVHANEFLTKDYNDASK